jgi:hypothetical protein
MLKSSKLLKDLPRHIVKPLHALIKATLTAGVLNLLRKEVPCGAGDECTRMEDDYSRARVRELCCCEIAVKGTTQFIMLLLDAMDAPAGSPVFGEPFIWAPLVLATEGHRGGQQDANCNSLCEKRGQLKYSELIKLLAPFFRKVGFTSLTQVYFWLHSLPYVPSTLSWGPEKVPRCSTCPSCML